MFLSFTVNLPQIKIEKSFMDQNSEAKNSQLAPLMDTLWSEFLILTDRPLLTWEARFSAEHLGCQEVPPTHHLQPQSLSKAAFRLATSQDFLACDPRIFF